MLFFKRSKRMKTIKKIEPEEINCISYSVCWGTEENTTRRFTYNCDNIIFESFINDKLVELKEIDQEYWNGLLDILFHIIKKRKYSWNNQYSVGISLAKKKNHPIIKILNKIGEYIEITLKYDSDTYFFTRQARYFNAIEELFSCVEHEKWNSYKNIDFY